MAAFVIVAKVNAWRADAQISQIESQKEILVAITGEVSKPGMYKVFAGTTVESALKKAKPKKFSNIKDLPLKKIIEEPLTIDVKALSEIRVKVDGEVSEPMELRLKPKTRICDLKLKLTLTKDADKTFFKSRKQLLDGEVVLVPKKTVEQNSSD